MSDKPSRDGCASVTIRCTVCSYQQTYPALETGDRVTVKIPAPHCDCAPWIADIKIKGADARVDPSDEVF